MSKVYKSLDDEFREKYPEKYEAIEDGSRKEAIYLYCLKCVGGSSKDRRECTGKKCELYYFRCPEAKPPGRKKRIIRPDQFKRKDNE